MESSVKRESAYEKVKIGLRSYSFFCSLIPSGASLLLRRFQHHTISGTPNDHTIPCTAHTHTGSHRNHQRQRLSSGKNTPTSRGDSPLEHPGAWVVMSNGEKSGFFGWQVYWGVDTFDAMQMPGDRPAVDQVSDVSIAGQPAKRVTGHYLGALADMGFQEYVKYIIQKGDLFYSFTLLAVDARGVPSNMMNDSSRSVKKILNCLNK